MHSGNVRLPRPPRPQGAVPQALDHAHQRGGPPARHVLLPIHQRPEGSPASSSTARSWPTWPCTTPPRSPRSSSRRRPPPPRPEVAPARRHPVLTSAKNPKVASAVRLRKRAFREETRRFLLEGAQAVGEALDAGRLEMLFTTDDADPLAVRAQAGRGRDASRRRRRRPPPHLHRHPTGGRRGRGVPRCRAREPPRRRASTEGDGCVALLHEVRDPGNAGTVLRSADAAGAGGVVFSETSVDVYNPKTVRASAGSVFHLPVVRGAATLETIEPRQGARRPRARDGRRGRRPTCIDTDLSGPVIFVFGNEAQGLPDDVVAVGRRRASACPSPAGRNR